jgi:hypothetical protein
VTSDLGFIRLLDRVIAKTSGLDVNQLAGAIAVAGNPPSFDALMPVLRSSSEASRKEELVKLRAAIITGRSEYSASLDSWFKEVFPNRVDEVILCGGTADYLRSELSAYFKNSSLVWHGKMPHELEQHPLSHRFFDAFGVYEFLRQLVWERVKTEVREAKAQEHSLALPQSGEEVVNGT